VAGSAFGALIGAVRTGTLGLYAADLNANPGLLNRWYRSQVTVSGQIEPGGLPAAGWTIEVVILVSPGGTGNAGPFAEVGQFTAITDGNGNWTVQEPGAFDNRDTLTFNVVGVTPPPGYEAGTFSGPAGSWYDPDGPNHPSPWPQGAWIDPFEVYAEPVSESGPPVHGNRGA
jgi:hypothetical protein